MTGEGRTLTRKYDKEELLHGGENTMKPYWLAVEGLDGSGKSTTVMLLVDHLNAVRITNPPANLAAERIQADRLPNAEKRAWYLKANIEAARQATAARDKGRLVVMDRSVASTLAFAAAEQGRTARPDEWPSEVPQPDLLLLLNVPEPERCRRL